MDAADVAQVIETLGYSGLEVHEAGRIEIL